MTSAERKNAAAMRAGQAAWDNAEPPESDYAVCTDCEFECSDDEARELEGACPECGSDLERA